VPEGARIEGRTAQSLQLQYRHGVTLLGVSRQGKQFRERVRHLEIREGDVLLLYGASDMLAEISYWLGTLPLAGRNTDLIKRHKAWLAVGLFAAAIATASFGLLYLPIALAAVVASYVMFNIIPARHVYDSIECAAWFYDPDWCCAGIKRWYGTDRRCHYHTVGRLLTGGGADSADGRHDDSF